MAVFVWHTGRMIAAVGQQGGENCVCFEYTLLAYHGAAPNLTWYRGVVARSGGLARQMSMGILGKQVDGIWHTGILVHGREIFFGGGIQALPPSVVEASFGIRPVQVRCGSTVRTLALSVWALTLLLAPTGTGTGSHRH